MSSLYELARQLRLSFTDTSDARSLAALLSLADDLVSNSSSVEPEVLSAQLEQELQTIHDEVVDHSSVYHAQVLLAVLFHLKAVLTPLTIITFWFDICLRPALREPKLATSAVNNAKELILAALHSDDERYQDKICEFRTRLLDLYLLDALNEGSEEDVLEWAELDTAQRERKSCWKSNLEDILLRFGEMHPLDLMSHIHQHFNLPSLRLQLLMFMNLYTSSPVFESLAANLASQPLMSTLLSSLLYDNSSTSCAVGLTILVKLLPMIAVHASAELKRMIPQLFTIFVRVLCWKERRNFHDQDDDGVDFVDEDAPKMPALRPETDWQQLELMFGNSSTAPSSVKLFTYLYYLFPCNLLKFLRNPIAYLTESDLECPYVGDWESTLDASEIRTKSEHLIRGHICHPLIIWQDAQDELLKPDFWKDYDVARISSEAMSLDVRFTSIAFRERYREKSPPEYASSSDEDRTPAPTEPASTRPNELRLSFQSMVATSVLLKSTADIKAEPITQPWPRNLFSVDDASTTSKPASEADESVFEPDNPPTPSRVTQAISGLQREVLTLRNELNFELWLSRENVKHIGRLFQDRIISRNAEVERQGLYNKLRNYRTQVVRLEKELREHKQLASSARQKHTDWSSELQTKLREFREEKKSWVTEAATLRTTRKEIEAQFSAQSTLLAEANAEVFKLQTFIKEHQHKIDRLYDYEAQIEQSRKMQRLWDADFDKFKRRGEDIDVMKSQWKQMSMRLESLEQTQMQMEDQARQHRRQIQSLESRQAHERAEDRSTGYSAMALASVTADKSVLMNANKRLQERNTELLEEVEELEIMVEQLRAQVSGRQGLISEPPQSPLSPLSPPIL
ncbi:MAG: hypothetical protein NXY57DRAFT_1046822 [Lentinula lateritia]|uniref:Hamartin n=1 Tax=Lentinula lateritia TaxID=40482 RepID=A0ABQ8VJ27_9AGAR|nr:MAG: hypothetical protein NXY57DRAFT_1046822 [Lentinula lateritia]KAJ4495644.1 hypothetical protein C8R41DRAFT_762273 [Lentinula lateritia]